MGVRARSAGWERLRRNFLSYSMMKLAGWTVETKQHELCPVDRSCRAFDYPGEASSASPALMAPPGVRSIVVGMPEIRRRHLRYCGDPVSELKTSQSGVRLRGGD